MKYIKTKLNDIKVGDTVNMAAPASNGHDFKFVDATVTSVVHTKSLFKNECVDLVFGKHRERFHATSNYLFDVKVTNELTKINLQPSP
jgi:hypothetical protein